MTEDEIKKIFGQDLRSKRQSLGLSQAHLALISDTDQSYIGKIERGQVNITITSYVKLVISMGYPVPDFFSNRTEK